MKDYMDRRVTPPERVASPTWGSPPPYKQVLRFCLRKSLGVLAAGVNGKMGHTNVQLV